MEKKHLFCPDRNCLNYPKPKYLERLVIKNPFERESFPIQRGNRVITRKFALLPQKSVAAQTYKRLTKAFVKFRDVENSYIRIMIQSLHRGQLSIQDFSGTSKSHIKSTIYDTLSLSDVMANEYPSIELKERAKRCAVQYPYHAVRNWIIRNENLASLIELMVSKFAENNRHVISFLLGKGLARPMLRDAYTLLGRNKFGEKQSMSYFYIDNMVGQVRNLFLENTSLNPVLASRLQQIQHNNTLISQFLTKCLNDFTYKKKSRTHRLTIPELSAYFLKRYFAALKGADTRRKKKNMSAPEFRRYRRQRDSNLNQRKDGMGNLSLQETQNLAHQAFRELIYEFQTNPNVILIKHIFKPSFRRSPLTTPTPQGFEAYFKNVLQNKLREHFKELFLIPPIINALLSDLRGLRQSIHQRTKIPEINTLSVPIETVKERVVFDPDYSSLSARLSLITRKFYTLKINDNKRRISKLLGENTIVKTPVITYRRHKLILSLPFEVQKKAVSKPSQFKKSNRIEMGVDLGLKHFATVSIWNHQTKTEARYFIGSKELFDMKFDGSIRKFVMRRNHRSRNPSNIKLKIIHLREEIRNAQRKKSEYEERCRNRGVNPKKKLKYNKLAENLSILWEKLHRMNHEIVRSLNHNLIAIAAAHGVTEITMENLKFSKHSKKRERGKYLAFWQTHWLFSQIQDAVELQAYLHGIGFQKVSAYHTSKKCSECGKHKYIDSNGVERETIRDGKQFICGNVAEHKNNKIFRLDADLNAARNIASA